MGEILISCDGSKGIVRKPESSNLSGSFPNLLVLNHIHH